MSRIRIALASIGVAALLVPTAAFGTASKTVLTGTVLQDFTITLKNAQGAKVTKLKPGVYVFKVNDKASIHNFRVVGPGVNKMVTGIDFVGTKSVTVTLKKGKYQFWCDPHASSMKGSFVVA